MDTRNLKFRKPGFWGKFREFVTGEERYVKGEFASIGLFDEDKPFEVAIEKITTILGIILVIFALLFAYGFISAATNNRITRFDAGVAINVMNNVAGKPHEIPKSELSLVVGGVRVMDADKKLSEKSIETIQKDLKPQIAKSLKLHGGINVHPGKSGK